MINDHIAIETEKPSKLNFAQKKELKKESNVISVALISELVVQFIAVFAAIIILILYKVIDLHSKGSFNAGAITKLFTNLVDDPAYNFLSIFIYFSYMFIPFSIVAVCLKQNPFKVIPFKFKNSKILLPIIIIGLAASSVGTLYSSYFSSLLSQFNLQMNESLFSMPKNTLSLVFSSLTTCIFAPFCEEFLFRGLIMQRLRKYGDFFALLISSLLFGILHANFSQTPFAFLVGLGLGFAVLETGSIFAGIIIHFLINTISTVLNISALYIGDTNANIIYYIYSAVIVIAAIVSLIYLIKRKQLFKGARQRYFNTKILTTDVFSTFIKTAGLIIFLVLFVSNMFLLLKVI